MLNKIKSVELKALLFGFMFALMITLGTHSYDHVPINTFIYASLFMFVVWIKRSITKEDKSRSCLTSVAFMLFAVLIAFLLYAA